MEISKNNYYWLSICLFIITGLNFYQGHAQSFTKEEFNDSIKNAPYFSIHKENYFITGVPTNKKIGRSTANAKYQISFKQIVTKKPLPWNTYLYLTYTQKAFWNIYENSFPFRDINFNPSISLNKPIFNKNEQLKGFGEFSLEHESNGRDSISSRTWNRLNLSYTTKLFGDLITTFKVWLPFSYQETNADFLDYVGYGEISLSKEYLPNKLSVDVNIRKGWGFDTRGVIRSRIYYSPFKKNPSDQYIMLEWYLGQAESLLDYRESRSIIRIGYVIKSNEFKWFRKRNYN